MPAAARKHRADEESHGTSAVPNPYSGPGPDLSSNLLIDKMKRLVYIGVSLYFLQRMAFWSAIVQSPHIRHEWFKIGLATAIALIGIKAYVELFEGMMNKKQVNYKNFKNATHVAMVLILLASIAFHVALWPQYGWNTPVVLFLAFVGVAVQAMVIIPVWLQNIVTFVGLTFFLQQYQ